MSENFRPNVCGKYALQGSSRALYTPLDPTHKECSWPVPFQMTGYAMLIWGWRVKDGVLWSGGVIWCVGFVWRWWSVLMVWFGVLAWRWSGLIFSCGGLILGQIWWFSLEGGLPGGLVWDLKLKRKKKGWGTICKMVQLSVRDLDM